jgi:hypothetical protein
MLSWRDVRRLIMSSYRHRFSFVALLAVVLLAGATSTWAGGYRHHGPYYGHGHHGHHGHSSFRLGLNWAYPPPYWGGYPYYPAWRPYYAPAYGPGGGVVSIGYGSGGHHSSWGLGLTLPLSFGPRYAPPPAPAPLPTAQPARPQPGDSCLQVREYQTEIVVGGKPVPAYGDACLQPDGSWNKVSGPFAAE